jgi:hypothetical protein
LAARHGLPPEKVADVQATATAYQAWLQEQNVAPERAPDYGTVLLNRVRPLAEELRRRRAGCRTLRLAHAPWITPIACPLLRTPNLSGLLFPGSRVLLLWRRQRGVLFDLHVCRDGYTWQPLWLAAAEVEGRFTDALPLLEYATRWRYRGRYRHPGGATGPWSQVLQASIVPGAGQVAGLPQALSVAR